MQRSRWKASKARYIGAGFTLYYPGVDMKRNVLSVILKDQYARNVVEMKRVLDRVMSVKLEI